MRAKVNYWALSRVLQIGEELTCPPCAMHGLPRKTARNQKPNYVEKRASWGEQSIRPTGQRRLTRRF